MFSLPLQLAPVVASDGTAAPLIAAIVNLTGLGEAMVTGIITAAAGGCAAGGLTAVEIALEKLCEAMGPCS